MDPIEQNSTKKNLQLVKSIGEGEEQIGKLWLASNEGITVMCLVEL